MTSQYTFITYTPPPDTSSEEMAMNLDQEAPSESLSAESAIVYDEQEAYPSHAEPSTDFASIARFARSKPSCSIPSGTYVNASNNVPYPAHQPISPEYRSTYSELAPHLEFMRKLKLQEESTPDVEMLPDERTETSKPQPSNSAPNNASPPTPILEIIHEGDPDAPPFPTPTPPPLNRFRNTKEPRKPSAACTFCRERKIACGRPPADSEDQTCNQCARRAFVCQYKPPESIRKTGASRLRRKPRL